MATEYPQDTCDVKSWVIVITCFINSEVLRMHKNVGILLGAE